MDNTILIKIIKTKDHTWYSNKLGWVYEVYDSNFFGIPCFVLAETVDHGWPLFISKIDCEVIG